MKVSENKARQGRSGTRVLLILVVALLLAMLVWFGVGLYGDSIAPEEPLGDPQTPVESNGTGG